LNVQAARSSFDVPNTLDAAALGQNQHQNVNTFNVAPGYSQALGSRTLLTANAYVRRDHLTYLPSSDLFADQPGTVSQDRSLTNYGFKADVAYTAGRHNFKVGGSASATRLNENFSIGFTDPSFNSPSSPDFDPSLLPFDLTRGGSLFVYHQSATIKQQAGYAQDGDQGWRPDFKLGVQP
jgi:hypothetical protein